ncbi:MAG: ParB/RepB/Spo0J family partition protein [Clostridiales Family XIII bacterium]|jgi:ParB family chromosome partitioning protein|nr:ParB/RepB/Spo0J family partition protein [Clostridiales Family XIII bacterium]
MSSVTGRGLGKGLGALFEEAGASVPVSRENADDDTTNIQYIDIHEIKPNAKQPRVYFKEEAIDELAASIKTHGVIQPLIVRSVSAGFELVAGERRWRAAKKAGLKVVPCIVREIDEEQRILFALIENIQREDLNPVEEAVALRQAMDIFGLTQDEMAKSVGKSRPYITNALRLLKLPDDVRVYMTDGRLSGGHGKAIAALDDPKKQSKLAAYLAEHGCSVREAEALAADPRFAGSKTEAKPRIRVKEAEIIAIEEELHGLFGTKVNIHCRGDRGSIELSYYSREELEELIAIFRALEERSGSRQVNIVP